MMPADRDHHNIFLFYYPSVLFSISVICCLVRVLAEVYHGTDGRFDSNWLFYLAGWHLIILWWCWNFHISRGLMMIIKKLPGLIGFLEWVVGCSLRLSLN